MSCVSVYAGIYSSSSYCDGLDGEIAVVKWPVKVIVCGKSGLPGVFEKNDEPEPASDRAMLNE